MHLLTTINQSINQ